MDLAHSAAALALAPTLGAFPSPPRPAFERLAAMGFRHVQLSASQDGLRPRELDRSARRDLLATMRRHELSVGGIDIWIPAAHFLDVARIDRAVALVGEAIGLAEDLGRCPVSCTLPGQEAGVQVLEALVAAAEQRGVRLADHALPPSDAADVGIDPAACLAVGTDPAAAILRAGSRVASVRLSDLLATGLRGPIGGPDGRLDVTAYRVAIDVAGYTRAVVVDARQWTDPWAGLAQTRETWG